MFSFFVGLVVGFPYPDVFSVWGMNTDRGSLRDTPRLGTDSRPKDGPGVARSEGVAAAAGAEGGARAVDFNPGAGWFLSRVYLEIVRVAKEWNPGDQQYT